MADCVCHKIKTQSVQRRVHDWRILVARACKLPAFKNISTAAFPPNMVAVRDRAIKPVGAVASRKFTNPSHVGGVCVCDKFECRKSARAAADVQFGGIARQYTISKHAPSSSCLPLTSNLVLGASFQWPYRLRHFQPNFRLQQMVCELGEAYLFRGMHVLLQCPWLLQQGMQSYP